MRADETLECVRCLGNGLESEGSEPQAVLQASPLDARPGISGVGVRVGCPFGHLVLLLVLQAESSLGDWVLSGAVPGVAPHSLCCPPACRHELLLRPRGPRGLGTRVLARVCRSSRAGRGGMLAWLLLLHRESPVFPSCGITRPGNSSLPRPPLWPPRCVSSVDGRATEVRES